jgi:serine protease Do
VAINGKPIREGSQLIGMVTATPVGSPLNITVEREGKRENLKVVVGDLAQIFPDRFGNRDESSKSAEATTVSFGMQIQNLTEKQQESLGLKQKGGVQVVSVEPGSFADDIRLQPGDVIISINRRPVNTKEDITRIRDTLKPGDAVQFRVMRKTGRNGTDWSTNFVAGTLPLNGR